MKPPDKAKHAWSQGYLRLSSLEYKRFWPHEIASKYIIPALRGLLSHVLTEKGLSQHVIAGLIGVTQPMVSRYLRKPVDYYYGLLEELGLRRGIVEHVVRVLARQLLDTGNDDVRLVMLSSVVNDLLLHTEYCMKLEKSVDCSLLFGVAKDPYISEVERALLELKSIEEFGELLPSVGSNLVYSPFSDTDTGSIIGLEGRIIRGAREIIIGGKPAYGGSKHTAKILSEILRKDPSKRACIVLKYDRLVERSLEALKQKIVYVERTGGEKTPEEPLLLSLRLAHEAPDAVIDKGGHGIEPVVYLFASSPGEIVEKIKKIIRVIETYKKYTGKE